MFAGECEEGKESKGRETLKVGMCAFGHSDDGAEFGWRDSTQ